LLVTPYFLQFLLPVHSSVSAFVYKSR